MMYGSVIKNERRDDIMAYGQSDTIAEERKGRQEAVKLLLEVAEGKKNVAHIRSWLEKNYPEMCYEKPAKIKKW